MWCVVLVSSSLVLLNGCHDKSGGRHGSATHDGMSHISIDGWPFVIDCDGSAPWAAPSAIKDNFDAMCSYADDYFENECSSGVAAFGLQMKEVIDPETGESTEVLDEDNSTTHCGSDTLPGH